MTVLHSSNCGGSTALRVGVMGLSLALFAAGVTLSLLRGSVNSTVGLEAFVVAELAAFLTAPLGVDLAIGGRMVAGIVAITFGLLVGFAPRLVFGLLGVGLAVVSLWASTLPSDGCGSVPSSPQVVVVISGLAVYLLIRLVIGRFTG
ncbi:hypothetical protein [Aeromicrobium duanguangcaii]|uniref:hypothetical protein n=1 Tax=Aeromicrobium duanguangcaii TaxID=2968086 RepID=UPI002016CF0D|nr:hypothetical protein [Aeromicrobium duanguangcaii]MCL3836873.1 hypothetical protein [Aeromicrobium duanguangcaii]